MEIILIILHSQPCWTASSIYFLMKISKGLCSRYFKVGSRSCSLQISRLRISGNPSALLSNVMNTVPRDIWSMVNWGHPGIIITSCLVVLNSIARPLLIIKLFSSNLKSIVWIFLYGQYTGCSSSTYTLFSSIHHFWLQLLGRAILEYLATVCLPLFRIKTYLSIEKRTWVRTKDSSAMVPWCSGSDTPVQ